MIDIEKQNEDTPSEITGETRLSEAGINRKTKLESPSPCIKKNW